MLAVVCKSYAVAGSLECYDEESGRIDREQHLHAIANEFGKSIKASPGVLKLPLFPRIHEPLGKNLPFPSNDPTSPGSSIVWAPFPPYAMLPQRKPTTLRACGIFARRSMPVVPSSPLAVWAGCPSLQRSVRLWIT
ncbi:hypothetical protein Syun_006971 [Stephania yunnanensis]|uniref:Uncharacterized protein n=1 Tax=Stephania yunnanensis TaxID=152371 RepID=A0AAP0PYZ5_9MAGN